MFFEFENNREKEYCINCGEVIKEGLLFSNLYLSDMEFETIKQFYEGNLAADYCEKCGRKPLSEATNEMLFQKAESQKALQKLINDKSINAIPITTTSTPHLWQYEVVGMVTGQSTTGTGVLSDFFSSITDFFGIQSSTYNKKIKSGEEMCGLQVRLQTLKLGGNAIIGTDIDYSDLGAEKGMIMVAMAGTAIKLKNTDILGAKVKAKVEEITKHVNKLEKIELLTIEE